MCSGQLRDGTLHTRGAGSSQFVPTFFSFVLSGLLPFHDFRRLAVTRYFFHFFMGNLSFVASPPFAYLKLCP